MKRAACAASIALALCLPASAFAAEVIDVLWYAYSPEGAESRYRERMRGIGAQVPRLTDGEVSWRITFFGPGETPNFRAYDVLVTESSFLWVFDGSDGPDYDGLLDNEAGLAAARGNRILLTGASGLDMVGEGSAATVQDSDVGLLINWVNWAGSGSGLGVVALDDEDRLWKRSARSFLRFEADAATDFYYDCCGGGAIPAYARDWPINRGISDATMRRLGEQTSSFKLPEPPGYKAIAIAPALDARVGPSAPAVITESQAAGSTVPPPSVTCRARGGLLAQPITLSARSRPNIPVRMRLIDSAGATVGQGDLRASPLLAVQHGYRTQIVGPFTWCPRTRMWKTKVPSSYFNERGVHHVEVHPGDGSYDVEMCAQTVTRQ
jgi:hypothetical protein